MIDIHVDGRTYGKLGSGFAVILRSTSNIWKRSISYGNLSANQAEIRAATFGMLSVTDAYKNEETKLMIKNKYVRDMLEKDKDGCYLKVAKANADIITELRNMFDTFKNISVHKSEGDIAEECAKLVEDAVKNNEEINEKK